MWKFITLTAVIVLMSSVARSQDTVGSTEKSTTVDFINTTLTSTTMAPTTVTKDVTTTKLPVTTTKLPDTTTSVEPNTTTKPDTTTTKPDTTTSVPVTTAAPEPIPKPTLGSWNVTGKNGTTCIRVEMKALFTIPVKDKNIYIALSPNASDANSDCDGVNNTQILVLTDSNYSLTVEFEKDGSQSYVKNITFEYNYDGFQGNGYNSSKFFNVKNGNSYICNTDKTISLENITLSLSNLHIQAYGEKDNTGFGTAEECDADDVVSNIVPIAVGCALAALIIVVLIAYLVGRRRSRQKGYQSV